MLSNAVDCLQATTRLRENEHQFLVSSLSEFETSLLSSFSFTPDMTDYEYFKTGNQTSVHGLGSQLFGGVSWEHAKEEFVELENNRFVLEIQKACCKNNCFFDPLKCMDKEHDGKLKSLLRKELHESVDTFDDYYKMDELEPKFILEPPVYDQFGVANVDIDKLSAADIRMCKPSAEWELSKLLNIVEALLDGSEVSLEIQRKSMFNIFMQKCNGFNLPRLAAMGFGPFAGQLVKKRDYFDHFQSKNLNPEQRWSPNFFWMFTHGPDLPCVGKSEKISTPFLDHDGRVCFPCNTGKCHKKCLCEPCLNISFLAEEGEKHEEHLEEYNLECVLAKVQCTEHYVDHPDNFKLDEDLDMKVFNYLDMGLNEHEIEKVSWKRVNCPPRAEGNLQEQLKLAGLKKKCEVCRRNLNDHIKNHHALHVQCKICDIRSKTMHDPNFWRKTCPECKIYFPNMEQSEMKRHIKGHEMDFSCDVCGKGFRRQKYLNQHIEEIHGKQESRYICTICNKEYKQERNLRNHVKMRHSEDVETFQCRFCDSEFLYRFSLKRHLLSAHSASTSAHTNVFMKSKICYCEYCNASFGTNSLLKRHVATLHSQDKPFKCDVCEKVFARKDRLLRHKESTHEDAKFSCQFCDESFRRKDSLLKHAQKHLGQEFMCDLCTKKFNRKDSCNRHKKLVHKLVQL